jgi:hypothetical protein
MLEHYVLDEHGVPVLEPDLLKWARWFEQSWPARCVARTEIGDIHVSTVFLGTDHNFLGGSPILYESMIFGGAQDDFQRRYQTREQAIAGHDQIVAAVRAGTDPDPIDVAPI